MTPIIIATEKDGYAYVYYRDLAGGLTQTAQVLVGTTQPVELAKIVAELSDNLIWSKIIPRHNGDEPEPESKSEVGPNGLNARQRARRASTNRMKRSKKEIADFDARVLAEVRANPDTTIPAITRVLLGVHDKNSMSNVRASLDRLMKTGEVVKLETVEPNEPHRYSAATETEGHLETDTGLEPTDPHEAPPPEGG